MEISVSALLLYLAAITGVLLIVEVLLRKKRGFDFQQYALNKYQSLVKKNNKTKISPIVKSTGNKSLVLLDAGSNKATVTATLRQIMAVDATTAQKMVNAAPATILTNISDKEAVMNKQALEFVGAKLEIK